ncbi:MAG: hypothetical protein ACLFWF_09000 [Alphaproteobacteria bacterium]
MSDVPKTTEREDADLAAFVLRQAGEKAEEILAEARGRAEEIEREAFARARRRFTVIRRQEREQAREACRMAEAGMKARVARRQRQIDARRLETLRQELAGVLEEFWRASDLRKAWIRAALERAEAAFGSDGWTLELCGGPEAAEEVRGLLPADARIEPLETAKAGLRIRREGAVLDATAEGFLAQGARLDARLLAALEDQGAGGKT